MINKKVVDMSCFQVLFVLLLSSNFLFATDGIVGTIETLDGDTLEMYKHSSSRKLNFSKIPVGCDCSNQKYKFFYFNSSGKIEKLKESYIRKVNINKGTKYCKTLKSVVSAGDHNRYISFEAVLREDVELLSLPISSRGKRNTLQWPLVKNSEYILSIFQNDSGGIYVVIYSIKEKRMVKTMSHHKVGYGKKGKLFLEEVKTLFKDSKEFIDTVNKNELANKKKKRSKAMIPFLEEISELEVDRYQRNH